MMKILQYSENCIPVLPALHCIATLFNECKALYLSITSRFLYLSEIISRDRTMNSDVHVYELQMNQPFASGALCDRRH